LNGRAIPRSRLVTTAQDFPGHMRSDLQVAVETLLANPIRFLGMSTSAEDALVPLSQKAAFDRLENRDIGEIHRPTDEVRDGSPQIRRQ
jgi:hypothetical protein